MDNVNTTQPETAETERSAEEIAWDQEFADTKSGNDLASTVTDLLALAVKIPLAIIQMPVNMLPTDTRRHARAAVREGFLAARSLVGAIGDGIEGMLADPSDAPAPISGPPGTWGTARYATAPQQRAGGNEGASSSKVKRIEFEDEKTPPGEGRGLRADIDY